MKRPSRSKTKNHTPDVLRVVKTGVERTQPKIEGLTNVPKKCPKCGSPYLRIFKETISAFSVQMVHCSGSAGGCGKTWRLLNSPVRLLRGRKSDDRSGD